MNYNVAHFLRKRAQLKSSFIKNQVERHIKFQPVVIYKFYNYKGTDGYASVEHLKLPILNLSKSEDFSGKILFKTLKRISSKDISLIKKFIGKNNVDIFHFHYGTDAGIYYPLLNKLNIPSVVSFYGWDCTSFPKMYGGLGKRYLKNRVFSKVTKVLAMSEDMKKDLISIGCPEEKIIVHYYGTDVKLFNQSHDYQLKNNLVQFIILSGLAKKKGHLFLLQSFLKALKENKNIRLTIVGEGIMKQEIETFIVENNLNEYVTTKPSFLYASKEHLAYLRDYDVFVHPSIIDDVGDKEGIPGAIVEAMAAGLPVISTNHAGIPYVIENNKSGILVDEWDIDALANAMLKLADDEELRRLLGVNAQKAALNELDLDEKEKELEEIYMSLI